MAHHLVHVPNIMSIELSFIHHGILLLSRAIGFSIFTGQLSVSREVVFLTIIETTTILHTYSMINGV